MRPQAGGERAVPQGIEQGAVRQEGAKVFANDASFHAQHRAGPVLRKASGDEDACIKPIKHSGPSNAQREGEVVAEGAIEGIPERTAHGEEGARGDGEDAAVAFLSAQPGFISKIEAFVFGDAGRKPIQIARARGDEAHARIGEILDEQCEGVAREQAICVGEHENFAGGRSDQAILHGGFSELPGNEMRPTPSCAAARTRSSVRSDEPSLPIKISTRLRG